MSGVVVFVTDYGLDDTYAAGLTGACLRAEPSVRCVDGTHAVRPGDVLAAAYHVKALSLAFPAGTVICAVVDPGVGTGRGAIAAVVGDMVCVAPDTGAVTYLWDEAPPNSRRCVRLAAPEGASATYHGRDVFAPTGARLAAGVPLEDVGEVAGPPVLLDAALPRREGDVLAARVAVVDHFGNAITTARVTDLGGGAVRRARWRGGETSVAATTYDDIGHDLAVLAGSAGHLEIAARGRPAGALGGPAAGEDVWFDLA